MSKNFHRMLVVEIVVIILAEILCTENNWRTLFDLIATGVILLTAILYAVCVHVQKGKKDRKQKSNLEERKYAEKG